MWESEREGRERIEIHRKRGEKERARERGGERRGEKERERDRRREERDREEGSEGEGRRDGRRTGLPFLRGRTSRWASMLMTPRALPAETSTDRIRTTNPH